jgi:hypothetical protein
MGDVAATKFSSQSCDRKSKFGLRHGIKVKAQLALCHDEVRILIFDELPMIPPRNSGRNVPSLVPLNSTVHLGQSSILNITLRPLEPNGF